MKNDKFLIRAVKSASIFFLIILLILFFATILFSSKKGNGFYGILSGLHYTWRNIMLCISFLGGIQIFVMLKRYQKKFKKIMKS
jgi:hypothetical protein